MAKQFCPRAVVLLKSLISPLGDIAANVQRNPSLEIADTGDDLAPTQHNEHPAPTEDEHLITVSIVQLSGELIAELCLPSTATVHQVLYALERLGSVGNDPVDVQLLLDTRVLQEHETLEELTPIEEQPTKLTLQMIRVPHRVFYKFMVVGDTFVGKTWLCRRSTSEAFDHMYLPTRTIHCAPASIEFNSSGHVDLEIWDTPGCDWHRRCVYFRQATAVIIVFDLTSKDSFQNLHTWLDHISEERGDVLICLAGSKVDCTSQRQVHASQAEKFAAARGLLYCEISSKENIGIDVMLQKMVEALLHRRFWK